MDISRYLDLFLAESREHLGAAYELVAGLENGSDVEVLRGLMRHSHSMKGMSATMGYTSMVQLTHAMEDLFTRMLEQPGKRDEEAYVALLNDGLACLGRIVDSIERGQSSDSARAEEIARELIELAESSSRVEPAVAAEPAEVPLLELPRALPPAPAQRLWRVSFAFHAEAISAAGEIAGVLERIARLGAVRHVSTPMLETHERRLESRVTVLLESSFGEEQVMAELRQIDGVDRFSVEPEARTIVPRATQSRKHGWARVPAELLDRVQELTQDLLFENDKRGTSDSGPERRLGFLLRDLYGAVAEMRLVPFESVAHRFNQCVRELSRELEKPVQFQVGGGELRLDRSLLDGLVDPILHLLRNAMDHGIESVEQRSAAGKLAVGRICLEAKRAGAMVQITVEDDGCGLCADALRTAAVERGLLARDEAARLGDAEARMLITLPSFSTRTTPTTVSGRGVGLYEARESVEALGGRIGIETPPGGGTCIAMTLPITMALVPALLVRAAGELFAIPATAIRRCVDLDRTATAADEQAPTTLVRLAERLGLNGPRGGYGAVLVFEREDAAGLVVDEIIGRRELVVRPLRSPLAASSPISGAALLADGSIALVVDPALVV